MNRNIIIVLLALLIVSCKADQKPPPNIILFLVDDMGWNDPGFMGSTYHQTPRMDQLAAEGMVFTQAYANCANCAPTRASLMSGQEIPRHGIYTVGNPARGHAENRQLIPAPNITELDTSIVTIAELLRKAGYATAHIGKWHLGEDETGPLNQGFDVNVGGNHKGHPRAYFSPYNNKALPDGPDGEYLTDRLTDEAVHYISENKDRPFFMYFSHYSVHTPIQGKKELVEKYEQLPGDERHNHPVYAAMVESTDQSLGRIVDALKAHDIDDNTLIVFFSDNGGHAVYTNMSPLRGSKGSFYEGGIREPMVMWWPGQIEPGQCETPVTGLDFYPTFARLAKVELPDQPVDGRDLMPLVNENKSLEERDLFWHFPAYLEGYLPGQVWRTTPVSVIRSGKWKLLHYYEDEVNELYNLETDPNETINLAKQNEKITNDLFQRLRDWQGATGALIPTELNPLYQAD